MIRIRWWRMPPIDPEEAGEQLRRIARELFFEIRRIREESMATIDTSKLDALTAEVEKVATGLKGGAGGGAAAQLSADQTAHDASVAKMATAVADLQAAAGGASGLTVSPTTASFTHGTAGQVALTITGGTAPLTATGLPAGVSFDGANLNADGTQVAGTSTVTLSDSSTPVKTASITVTVS